MLTGSLAWLSCSTFLLHVQCKFGRCIPVSLVQCYVTLIVQAAAAELTAAQSAVPRWGGLADGGAWVPTWPADSAGVTDLQEEEADSATSPGTFGSGLVPTGAAACGPAGPPCSAAGSGPAAPLDGPCAVRLAAVAFGPVVHEAGASEATETGAPHLEMTA